MQKPAVPRDSNGFSPVLQAKYILSETQKEKDAEIEGEEYIRWKGRVKRVGMRI